MLEFIPDIFVSALVSFFVIVDPFGSAAVFASITKRMDGSTRKRIALKAVSIAVCLVITFSLMGEALLSYMGVSISAFRVAGGILLFVTAFRMIMGYHDPDQLESEDNTTYKNREDIAVFPMAIPILAGPGVMTTGLVFSTSAQSHSDYIYIFGAIIAVQILALISLLGAQKITKFFGETGNSIIARVMGILLAAMSIQLIADGVADLLHLI